MHFLQIIYYAENASSNQYNPVNLVQNSDRHHSLPCPQSAQSALRTIPPIQNVVSFHFPLTSAEIIIPDCIAFPDRWAELTVLNHHPRGAELTVLNQQIQNCLPMFAHSECAWPPSPGEYQAPAQLDSLTIHARKALILNLVQPYSFRSTWIKYPPFGILSPNREELGGFVFEMHLISPDIVPQHAS